MERVCEMCLKRGATEKHHIIPKVAEVPGFNINRDDNIIYLCSICHSRLTPTSALSSYALRIRQARNDAIKTRNENIYAFAGAVYKELQSEPYADEVGLCLRDILINLGVVDKSGQIITGKQIGQRKGVRLTTKKSIAAKEIIKKRSKDFDGDLSDAEVMKLTGIARGTYYKYKRELKEVR